MLLRYWTVTLLALVPTAAGFAQTAGKADRDKDIRITGQLKQDDPPDTRRKTPCQIHVVRLKRGRSYTIDMVSRQLDSYLRLEDKDGTQLAEDDDSGGMLNARIQFDCPRDGEYKVICTCLGPKLAGPYTLTIRQLDSQVKNAASHAALVGKPAPDFKGNFAINGPIRSLADLKGKVVLLEFFDVRSAACATTFPRLRDWHKAHKDAGLEIIGVTYYPFDIGQRLRFDKGTGKFTDQAKASLESEQANLRDFAAFHKLDYLIVALAKADALKTFDQYVVNGVPEFVLIDRKGVVHSIVVGEGANAAAALEGDLKKVLEER
jgi:hypothetical protein